MMATLSEVPLPEECYAASFRRQVEHVKSHVKCIAVADSLCGPAGAKTGLKRVGDKWAGLCPLPDHDEKTPSFTVYAEDERGWYCFGCNRGGDVLDLWQLAHGYAEKWEALVSLAMEYGVELLGRSERWHEARGRKVDYLQASYEVLGEELCRRLYQTLILPFIDLTEDPALREEALQRSWASWQGKRGWARYVESIFSGDETLIRTIARLKLEAGAVSQANAEAKPGARP